MTKTMLSKTTKMRPIALICIFVVLVLSNVTPVLAGLGVSGALYMAEVAPGERVYHKMAVCIDEGDEPMDVGIEIVGFGQSPDGGNLELDPDEDISPYSAREFLSLSVDRLHLDYGECKEVVMEGTVPDDVGEGGRYALVRVRSVPQGEGESVGIAVAVDVPVLIMIPDSDLLLEGEITDLKVRELKPDVADVSLIFKNIGNYHYKASAEVVLEDEDGNVLSSTVTPITFNSIIPANSRLFKVKLDLEGKLEPGTYRLSSKVISTNGATIDEKEIEFEV